MTRAAPKDRPRSVLVLLGLGVALVLVAVVVRRRGLVKSYPTGKHAHYHDSDFQLLSNAKALNSIRMAFAKSRFKFNLYVFTDDVAMESIDLDKAEELLGRTISTAGRITVIYTNNLTVDYIPMTPWIFAHRLAHGFQFFDEFDNVAQKVLFESLSDIYNAVKPISAKKPQILTDYLEFDGATSDKMRRMSNILFTMKSARTARIHSNIESLPEIFAQFLLTGRVRFNRMKDWDLSRNVDLLRYGGRIT
ncbi:MAG: hypothetical protein JWR24_3715, partial [Actinoallomurus sp.]|nr:hypothetical protein [Actinoallomurus sp.]